MKRKTLFLLTLVAVLCFGFCLTAQAATAAHTHKYANPTVVCGTCTTPAVTTYTCSCGAKKIVKGAVDANNHPAVARAVTRKATCTTSGLITETCVECGKVLGTITVKATGHDTAGGASVTAPTCTKTGKVTIHCSKCGAVSATSTISALGHNYANPVTVCGTCTVPSVTTYTCVRCQAKKVVKGAVDANSHAAIKRVVVQKATCTAAGKVIEQCADCGKVLKTSTVKATGHDTAGSASATAPTCTKAGKVTIYCSKCGAVSQTSVIAAKGHSMKQTGAVPGDCCSQGTVWLKCQNAGCSYTATVKTPKVAGSHSSIVKRGGYTYCNDCGTKLN